MYQTGCRYFSGYKPCEKNSQCDETCPSCDIPQLSILIVHLGAMGAVLRATALLPMIKQKFVSSKISWITDSPELLNHHPLVDLVFKNNEADRNKLLSLDFDIALILDKSNGATSILKKLNREVLVYGFITNAQSGAIEPATPAAFELWDIGLNDQKKFYENTKTELQLQAEALELVYRREPYGVFLNLEEKNEATQRKIFWSSFGKKKVVGLNTGCGPLLPEKKLTFSKWREILLKIRDHQFLMQKISLVLLGGPSEYEDHQLLKEEFSFLNLSSTNKGLRDGLINVDACDIMITGDSLGMHMGIGLKKYVIAWFGPSCAHEIDLYDRGEQLLAATMPCSPCWKRVCNKEFKCNDSIEVDAFLMALMRGLDFIEQVPPLFDSENVQISRFVSNKELEYPSHFEVMALITEMIL